jgi:hypothetical protein
MPRCRWLAVVGIAVCGIACLVPIDASAGTILKLGLGGDPANDIEFDGTTLRTVADADATTLGDQNTNVEFLDFLDSVMFDILTSTASFTLDGLDVSGSATTIAGVLVIQDFTGGTMELYDDFNVPLLSATLDTSVLTGPIGPPATGAVFSTSFGTVTGGTLAPHIAPNTLSLSMSLTNVNGGSGLSVSGPGGTVLDPFDADATLNIAAEQIPEPASAVPMVLGAALLVLFAARRRLTGLFA